MVAKAKFRLEGENATGVAFKQALAGARSTALKMQGVFTAAFAGISAASLIHVGRTAITTGDELLKAGRKAGVSAREISSLAYAADLADVSLTGLSTAVKFMQKTIVEAEEGSKEANRTLKALGLTVDDLRGLTADQRLELFADRIAALDDPAQRTTARIRLLGKAGDELEPLFENGAAGIRKAREEAERLGHVFSEEQLKALAEADDAIKRLSKSWESMAVTLTAKVAPGLSAAFDLMAGGLTPLQQLQKEVTIYTELLNNLNTAQENMPFGFAPGAPAARAFLESRLAEAQRNLDRFGVITRPDKPDKGDKPPGFQEDMELKELEITVVPRFDREAFDRRLSVFAGFDDLGEEVRRHILPVAIEAGDLIDARFDQFNDALLENTEEIAESTNQVFKKSFEDLGVYADESLRGIQRSLKDFFFDPIEGGIRGLGRSIVDTFREIFANLAAEKAAFLLIGARGKDGSFSGGFFSGVVNSLFGLDEGTNFVPRDMPALLHRGEAVVPAKYNPGAAGGARITFAPTYMIDAKGADAERVLAVVPVAMERTHERAVGTFLQIMRRNGFKLT